MRDIFLRAGFTSSLLDTVDGGDELPAGGIPGVFTGVNFGIGQHQAEMDKLAAFQPGKPLVVTELLARLVRLLGPSPPDPPARHSARRPRLHSRAWQRNQSLHVPRRHQLRLHVRSQPQTTATTSPRSPATTTAHPSTKPAHPTPKFLAFRKIFAKYATCSSPSPAGQEKDVSSRPKAAHFAAAVEGPAVALANRPSALPGEACLPPIPDPPPVITIPTITLAEFTPLWANLPKPIQSDTPKPMEQFDQAYGYILYRHQLPAAISGDLVPRILAIDELHDYAQIYLNGKLAGTLDRRDKQSTLAITTTGPARLDILVENSSRINFSQAMRGESKGITKSVTLAGQPLTRLANLPPPHDHPPKPLRRTRSNTSHQGKDQRPFFHRQTRIARGSNASPFTDSTQPSTAGTSP